jgi:hypothetical protein
LGILLVLWTSTTASKEEETCNVLLPNSTRPTNFALLMSLFEAMGKQGVMINWGKDNPCVGKADTPNAEGFAFWKGVACQPCNSDPKLYCNAASSYTRNLWRGPFSPPFSTFLTWRFFFSVPTISLGQSKLAFY